MMTVLLQLRVSPPVLCGASWPRNPFCLDRLSELFILQLDENLVGVLWRLIMYVC
jgi:hypothetical protein